MEIQTLLPYITLVFENVELMGLTNVPINLAWDSIGGYLIEFMGSPIGHAKSINEALYIIAEYVMSKTETSGGMSDLLIASDEEPEEEDDVDWNVSTEDLADLIKTDEEENILGKILGGDS